MNPANHDGRLIIPVAPYYNVCFYIKTLSKKYVLRESLNGLQEELALLTELLTFQSQFSTIT